MLIINFLHREPTSLDGLSTLKNLARELGVEKTLIVIIAPNVGKLMALDLGVDKEKYREISLTEQMNRGRSILSYVMKTPDNLQLFSGAPQFAGISATEDDQRIRNRFELFSENVETPCSKIFRNNLDQLARSYDYVVLTTDHVPNDLTCNLIVYSHLSLLMLTDDRPSNASFVGMLENFRDTIWLVKDAKIPSSWGPNYSQAAIISDYDMSGLVRRIERENERRDEKASPDGVTILERILS